MTGPEYCREAERVLESYRGTPWDEQAVGIARAQVYATLALADALLGLGSEQFPLRIIATCRGSENFPLVVTEG